MLAAMGDLPRTLAGTQLGITVASIGFTVEAAVEMSVVPALEQALPLPDSLLHLTSAALALSTVVASHTLLGEMVPKNLAVASPERSALWLGPLIRPFAVAVRPAVLVLSGLADAVLRVLRVEPATELAASHGVQEISDMLRLAGRAGVVEAVEHEMLERALRFARMAAGDVMVPWGEVTAVQAGTLTAEVERLLISSGHSRLPVLERREVLGFVNILDLQRTLTELPLRPVLSVHRSRRLVDVFEDLRQSSGRLAVVR